MLASHINLTHVLIRIILYSVNTVLMIREKELPVVITLYYYITSNYFLKNWSFNFIKK